MKLEYPLGIFSAQLGCGAVETRPLPARPFDLGKHDLLGNTAPFSTTRKVVQLGSFVSPHDCIIRISLFRECS